MLGFIGGLKGWMAFQFDVCFAERHFATPELYVTPWFLTLFSSKVQLPVLFVLWDWLMLERDSVFFCFISLAILISNRRLLLRTEVSQLPETLSKLSINSVPELALVRRYLPMLLLLLLLLLLLVRCTWSVVEPCGLGGTAASSVRFLLLFAAVVAPCTGPPQSDASQLLVQFLRVTGQNPLRRCCCCFVSWWMLLLLVVLLLLLLLRPPLPRGGPFLSPLLGAAVKMALALVLDL